MRKAFSWPFKALHQIVGWTAVALILLMLVLGILTLGSFAILGILATGTVFFVLALISQGLRGIAKAIDPDYMSTDAANAALKALAETAEEQDLEVLGALRKRGEGDLDDILDSVTQKDKPGHSDWTKGDN